MRVWLGVVSISGAVMGLPLSAAEAHMGPAQPPEFGSTECITVVDKRTTPQLYLPYGLPFDDVEPEPDKITLPDSKTHQFFAFRGSVVVILPEYEFWPATPAESAILPLWVNRDDLQRADAANNPMIAPDFRGADIGDDVLQVRPDIAGQWLEVSTAPARRPITIAQAMLGVYWNLTAVPAGVYQIVSYTFSPPYNGWEPRPGLVKIVDGAVDPPAVTVEPIDDILYPGFGRRVSGCIDTPEGSTLSSSYRLEGTTEWRPWLTNHPVSTGALDLCFVNPDATAAGMLRLRVSVRAPDGTETFAFSPDVTTQLNTSGMTCTESASRCCLATGMTKQPAPPPTAAGPEPMTAGTLTPGATAGMPAAGMPASQPPATGTPAAMPGSRGGCRATGHGEGSTSPALGLLLALWALRRRRG